MKRIILLIAAMLLSVETFAQQMIPKQKGFELTYLVFPQSPEKHNYALSAGLISYAKNGNYLFGLAEYSRKYYEYTHYDIPIDTFLFNGGYGFYLWGDLMRNININLGISGLVGYEQVNKGNEIIYDGSILGSTENFIYGAGGKLSLESYLTNRLVFLVNGQLRYLQNSQLGQFHTLFGLGLRFNFQKIHKMKNVINKKLSMLFRYSLVIFLMAMVISSCQENNIEIQKDFPFEVQLMPIPGKIAENETVEIRISLLTSSNFSGTTYSLRYFQYEGAGQLQYYSDPPYLPNDEYPLHEKQFRLYYTSKSSDSHQFSIWIRDSFGNEKRVDFEFDNAT